MNISYDPSKNEKNIAERGISFEQAAGREPTEALINKALAMAKKEPKRYRVMPEGKFVVFMTQDELPMETARYVLKELLKG